MTTLQQRLRHPVGCTLEDRIAAADAIECDRAILAARTNIMNRQCAAMNLALEKFKSVPALITYQFAGSREAMSALQNASNDCEAAIAALDKGTELAAAQDLNREMNECYQRTCRETNAEIAVAQAAMKLALDALEENHYCNSTNIAVVKYVAAIAALEGVMT